MQLAAASDGGAIPSNDGAPHMTAFIPPLFLVLSWVFALVGWDAPRDRRLDAVR